MEVSGRKNDFLVISKGPSSVRQTFDILIKNGTLHGFKEIAHASLFTAKLFWFIVTLGCFITSVIFITGGILENLAMPVAANLQYRTVDRLRMPQLMICPNDRYSKAISDAMGADINVLEYIELLFPFEPARISLVDEGVGDMPLVQYKANDEKARQVMRKHNLTDIYELSLALQFPCEYFVEAIWFSSTWIDPCKTEIGPFFTFTDYAPCLHFNLSDQYIGGMSGGLTMVLNIPPANETYKTKRTFDGNGVFGIPYDRATSASSLSNLLLFERGQFVDINFDTQNFIFLPTPENPCTADPEYDRKKCVAECLFEHSTEFCNCQLTQSVNSHDYIHHCTPLDLAKCGGVNTTLSDLLIGYKDTERNCKKTTCDNSNSFGWWFYEISRLQPEIGKPFNTNASRVENQIKINFYAKGIEYIVMQQFTTVTFTSIISQIGSTLGLWVGGSIITIVETFFYGMVAVCSFCGCIVVRYIANSDGDFSLKLRFRRRDDELVSPNQEIQSHSKLFELFSRRIDPV